MDKIVPGFGVPLKLFKDVERHIITCKLNSGELLKGLLVKCTENMDCHLVDVPIILSNGNVKVLKNVYIPGSRLSFVILPHMFMSHPALKVKKTGPKIYPMGVLVERIAEAADSNGSVGDLQAEAGPGAGNDNDLSLL